MTVDGVAAKATHKGQTLQVVLPEVFLKAFTVAVNLGADLAEITTANFDQIQHYRPRQNVVERPTQHGYSLTGHHEIMVPLVHQMIVQRL